MIHSANMSSCIEDRVQHDNESSEGQHAHPLPSPPYRVGILPRDLHHSNSAFCPPRRKLVTKATHLVEGDPLPMEWAKTEKARIRVGEEDPLSKERARKSARALAGEVVRSRRIVHQLPSDGYPPYSSGWDTGDAVHSAGLSSAARAVLRFSHECPGRESSASPFGGLDRHGCERGP